MIEKMGEQSLFYYEMEVENEIKPPPCANSNDGQPAPTPAADSHHQNRRERK